MLVMLNGVEVRNSARYFVATVEGVRYEIPEVWSIGYCTTHGGDARDAALAWHEQAQLEAAFRTFTDALGCEKAVYHDGARGLYCEMSHTPGEKTYRVDAEYRRNGKSHGWTARHADAATALGVARAFVTMEGR